MDETRTQADIEAPPEAEAAAETAAQAHESWRPDVDAETVQIEQLEGEPVIADIVDALRSVFDPEIPVNIYDLGLIYAIDSRQDGTVKVEMTLTAPGCPVAEEIPIWVRDAVATVEGTTDVDVEIVWDPPWDPSMMSEYAKIELGMF
jgi:FeS assembly SUF system protein